MDTKQVISEVVRKHGIRIDQDDPAFCLVTINQIVLEEAAARITQQVEAAIQEFNVAVENVHRKSAAIIADQVKASVNELRPLVEPRRLILRDRFRWFVIGVLGTCVVFAIGLLFEMWLKKLQ